MASDSRDAVTRTTRPPVQARLELGGDERPLFRANGGASGRADVVCNHLGDVTTDGGAIAFSPDGSQIAFGRFGFGPGDFIEVRDVNRVGEPGLRMVDPVANQSYGAESIAWNPSGRLLVSGTSRPAGLVKVWWPGARNPAGGRAVHALYRHDDNVTGVAFDVRGTAVVSTSHCQDKGIGSFEARPTVMGGLTDWEQGWAGAYWDGSVEIENLYGFRRPTPSPSGAALAVAREMKDDTTHVDVRLPREACRLVATIRSRYGMMLWNDAGAMLVVDDENGALVTWHPTSGDTAVIHPSGPPAEDLRTLCWAGKGRLVGVWSAEDEAGDRSLVRCLQPHADSDGRGWDQAWEASIAGRVAAAHATASGDVLLVLSGGSVMRLSCADARIAAAQ